MTTEHKVIQEAVEAQLLLACQSQTAGWEKDLVDWIRGNDAWLERRCVARLGCAADAEDAMQEITLKVLRAIGQFEGRSALRTWVTRIADNHCYTFAKQRAAKAMTAHLQYNIELVESDRFDQAEDDSDQVAKVRLTLSRLADKNREILQLRFFADLALDEIASSLELSLSATKMRLYRAMDAFKKNHVVDTI